MPEISLFFGMVIAMYYNDHAPPHFHVRYGRQKAIIGIDPLTVLAGRLSPKARTLVLEWAALHLPELVADWELARQQAPLNRIDPLEQLVLKDIVDVRPLEGYRLKLRFEDGAEGVVDVAQLVPLTGIFAALHERSEFVAVRVNSELGTICWPCGADLDPDVLYSIVTGNAIPAYDEASKAK